MSLLRLVGTLLWIGLLATLGYLAIDVGGGWMWGVFLGCLALFIGLVFAMRRSTSASPGR
jgi:membrane protein DedA with SNARE-associated domain